MKTMRKWFLYIAYTMISMGCFLYILFPSDLIRGAVDAHLFKTFPNHQIDIGDLKPILPPGLEFEKVTITQKDSVWGQIDELRVMPKIATVLSPQMDIDFKGLAHQGSLQGSIQLDQAGEDTKADLFLQLNDVQVADIVYLQDKLGKKLSGRLTGDLEIVNPTDSGQNVKGKLRIDDAGLELANDIINIKEVLLNTIDAEFTISKNVLSVKRFEALGGQVEGNLSGTIMLRKPMGKSRINLRGSFLPQEVLLAGIEGLLPRNIFKQRKQGEKGMPIRIYGTIDKPRFSFR